MRILLSALECGCHAWMEGEELHFQPCGTMDHGDQLLRAAQELGLPIELEP